MIHYDITIINASIKDANLVQKLKNRCKVLLVGEDSYAKIFYRNYIKTKNGYIVILHKNKKNIQISTEILLNIKNLNRDNILLLLEKYSTTSLNHNTFNPYNGLNI